MPADKHEDKHEDNQDASFRVIDRRLFSTEGELRPEVLEEKTE